MGELTLVDSDTVAPTNLNRQLEALHSTLASPRRRRWLPGSGTSVPEAGAPPHPRHLRRGPPGPVLPDGCRYDYIVDAIDLVSCKLDLTKPPSACISHSSAALGTGNKMDPILAAGDRPSKTYGCPLARVMRRELRARGIEHRRWCSAPRSPFPRRQINTPSRPPQRARQ